MSELRQPLKYLVDDGFFVDFYFMVNCYGNKIILPLKGKCWLPFAPTIGLVLSMQGAHYPPIKTLKYHIGTNKFTAYLAEEVMWDYNEQDVCNYYTLCVKAGGVRDGN